MRSIRSVLHFHVEAPCYYSFNTFHQNIFPHDERQIERHLLALLLADAHKIGYRLSSLRDIVVLSCNVVLYIANLQFGRNKKRRISSALFYDYCCMRVKRNYFLSFLGIRFAPKMPFPQKVINNRFFRLYPAPCLSFRPFLFFFFQSFSHRLFR